ncbi:MAG: heme A synthase [Deltaproteobacteria bacterium]|nr:MAG: heme A synthase [Deltaproteobacteria bacterium]
MDDPARTRLRLHRFATAVAGATLVLIFVGGLVTSTGSGLAVPDWPLSFGQLFPRMVGGVFYEHGHRLVAGTVGLATLVLTITVLLVDRRRSVRLVALAAIGAVIAQGLLGGLTVLLLLPPAVSVAHACLAQAFLCLTVALAAMTSPAWDDGRRLTDDGAPSIALLTRVTAVAVYGQLILGAVMRHTGAGLAIPDFPLAFGALVPPFDRPGVAIHFAHRMGAVVVLALVAWTASTIRARHPRERRLHRAALLACALVVLQITLGAVTVWSGKAVLPTTLHVAVGAALLATTFLLALRAGRLIAVAQPSAPPFVAPRGVAA